MISLIKVSHIIKEKRFTWESLLVDLLSTKLLLLPNTIFFCLSTTLPSTLPPLIALLTTPIIPTPRGFCFHKRVNPYNKNAF
jgi:hypothetical protein